MRSGFLLMAVLISLPAAFAIPTLRLTDPAQPLSQVVVVDADLDGVVTYSGAVGTNWTINVSTGLSSPATGGVLVPYMDLNTIDSNTAAAGTLIVEFSDDGFGPLDAGLGAFRANIGGTASSGATVLYRAFLDQGNVLFGVGTPLTTIGWLGPGPFSGTADSAYIGAVPAPYSLTLQVTIVDNSGGRGSVSSLDADLYPVPEPSALLLLGTGLAVVGVFRLRQK